MAVKKTVTPDPVVTLNDVYQVTLDKRCYILQRKSSPEDKDLSSEEKKTGVTNLGYFSTWEQVGKNLVEEISRSKAKQSKSEKIALDDYIKIIKETNDEVTLMFKNIDKQMKVSK